MAGGAVMVAVKRNGAKARTVVEMISSVKKRFTTLADFDRERKMTR